MERWQKFLNSLATRGGAIFLLFVLVLFGVALIGFVLWRAPGNDKVWLFATGFLSGFTAALTLALKGGGDEARVIDTGAAPEPPQKS